MLLCCFVFLFFCVKCLALCILQLYLIYVSTVNLTTGGGGIKEAREIAHRELEIEDSDKDDGMETMEKMLMCASICLQFSNPQPALSLYHVKLL